MGALHFSRSGSYLVWQHGVGYCFRIIVPNDLREVIGQREIRYTLRTVSRHEAKYKARKLASFMQNLFAQLRGGGLVEMAELSTVEIRNLMREYLIEVLEEDERDRALASRPMDRDELEEHLEVLGYLLSDIKEELATNNYRRIREHVDDLLEEKGTSLDTTSEAYKRLCREMLKAQIDSLEIVQRRSSGDYSSGLARIARPPLVSRGAILRESKEDDQGPPVSEVVERLAVEKKATKEWTDKTEADYRAAYNLFIEIMGDLPITQIDRQIMDSYKQTLMKLPPNMKKSSKYRDKSIEEILAMDVDKTLATETVNGYLIKINGLFNYAEVHGIIDKNPAKGLLLKKKKRDDQLRAAFDSEDLRKLFHSEKYLEDDHSRSYSFWVPVLALFTGARIDEICQLHLDDIRQEDGVWVFDINQKEEKKLKNPGSARVVPIHPFLLNDLKLLNYVESLKRRGEKRLFPELKQRREGYGQTVSKWFGRYRKACGVTEEDKVFHSFRHTFTNNLKQNDVNEVMISELVGHAVNSITMARYGKRYQPKKLFEAIRKLKYDNDLSHLSKSRFVVG